MTISLKAAAQAEAERDAAQLLSLENHNLAASNKARAIEATTRAETAERKLAEAVEALRRIGNYPRHSRLDQAENEDWMARSAREAAAKISGDQT